ncbi:condensation domain-containing protein [Microbispora hainanensis]|uniref:pentapeptide repeat-containing protein n=1 Tax=Microbispora hainanensis TaxID=568844 RepID=UPI0033C45318
MTASPPAQVTGLTPLPPRTVEFRGARGGEAALTWGQQGIWRSTQWLDDGDPYFNLAWTLPVTGAAGLDAVLRAVGRLVERHETLRTAFVRDRENDGADGENTGHENTGQENTGQENTGQENTGGENTVQENTGQENTGQENTGGENTVQESTVQESTVQRVSREGRLTVGVYEAAAKPMSAAKALAAELAATGFDYAAELPIRCAVVCQRDRPRALALALSHLALDGWSLNMVAAEWPRLVAGEDLPGPSRQPLDQAAFERSHPPPGGPALRHWRTGLAAAPRSMFDFPMREPEEPRFVRHGMDSPAAAVAAEALAARHGVTTSSVLTVASAALLAAVTGHRTAALQLIVSNRHHPGMEAMAGPAAQDGLCVIELGTGTFADALRHGHRRTMATYRNGHYDPVLVHAAWDAEAWSRGADIDLDAFFNDVRQGGRWQGLPQVDSGDAAALAALRKRTRTFFVGAYSKVKARIFFATGPSPSSCEFYVLVDTAFLPGDVALRMLTGLEELLVRAVSEDVPLDQVAKVAGLDPVARPAGWTAIGHDWVDVPETEALLRRACGTDLAAVVVEHAAKDAGYATGDGAGDGTGEGAADSAGDKDSDKDSGRGGDRHGGRHGGRADGRGAARLTGYLVARPGLETPEAVHAAVMRAATGRTDVLAPHHYVLCAAPPAGPAGWPACPRLAEGGGRGRDISNDRLGR